MKTSEELLSDPAHGLVREARMPQQQMAASVEDVLRDGGVYYTEAPVATGKTFAYLLPALLAQGRRIVVATAKKQLQDQIVAKDLPTLQRVLAADMPRILGTQKLATPLKGKGNYTCSVLGEAIVVRSSPEHASEYRTFVRRSNYGDRSDYDGMPPRWWGAASAEDCVGKRCANFDDCGYIRLRRDASQSKIVVINHHVLGAEMFFGHGKMVGGPYDTLIVDEAHTLAAGIRSAFTFRVAEDSIQSLGELLQRTSFSFPAIRRLRPPWEAMFASLAGRQEQESSSCEVPVFEDGPTKAALEGLCSILDDIRRIEALYGANTSEESDEDFDEEPDEVRGGRVMPIPAIEMEMQAEGTQASKEREIGILAQGKRRVDGLIRALTSAQGEVMPDEEITSPEDAEMRKQRILANTVVYTTRDERGRVSVNCAPVGVAGIAGKYLSKLKTVVLCSATLAVDGGFGHVTSVTGVAPTRTEILPTSFNYDAMGFVYVPRDLPVVGRNNPTHGEVMRQRVERAVRLCELSDGGAFVLTTANDELDAFAEALKARFPGRTFAQGHRRNPWDGDANTALARFRATRDAILVGSKSFWEGVDVPGGALRLVVMAKLPFPQYNDPIVKARERLAGESAFRDVQLVDMLIDLRQGVGRLIRTRDDRGCVAILDSRIWNKTYGGAVRRALPWSSNLVTSEISVPEKYLPKFAAHFKRTAA